MTAANKYISFSTRSPLKTQPCMPHVHSSAHMCTPRRLKSTPGHCWLSATHTHNTHHVHFPLSATPRSISSMMLNQCSSTALSIPRIHRIQDKRLSACARGCAPARQSQPGPLGQRPQSDILFMRQSLPGWAQRCW